MNNNSELDNLYHSLKHFFLGEHGSAVEREDIEKMEKFYDEMKSADMNRVIHCAPDEESKASRNLDN